jgi:hypothetical protein
MNHNEHPDEGHPRQALGLALDDIASTMPDAPTLLDGIYARADRLRRRRRAARGAAVVAACGFTLVGVVALRHSPPTEVSTPATAPTTVASPTPTTVPAPSPCDAAPMGEKNKPLSTADESAIEAQKRAAAAQLPPDDEAKKAAANDQGGDGKQPASNEDATKQAYDEGSLVKVIGTVTGRPAGDTVRVHVDDGLGLTGDIDVTITATTTFIASGVTTARTELVDGQRVAMVAQPAGSAYAAVAIDTAPGIEVATPWDRATALQGKDMATVVSVNGSTVTLAPLADWIGVSELTVDLNAVDKLHGDRSACSTVDLAPGDGVGIVVERATTQTPWAVTTLVFV